MVSGNVVAGLPCADVRLAEVYARAPLHGGARRLAALAADPGAVLVVSSAETLGLLEARALIAAAPRARDVRARPIIVSSPRLGDLATRAGFLDVRIAEGPTPEALVAAASRAWPLQS